MSSVISSPFFVQKTLVVPHEKVERFYRSIKIVDSVEKVSDDEFIVVKKVIEEKTPCRKVIQADKESVGVYNIIKQVMRTGDTSLLPADDGKCDVDLVGAPESLMEIKQAGVNAEKKFASLPGELTQGLDMASFVNSLTQEQFDAFITAMADRSKESEVKTDE